MLAQCQIHLDGLRADVAERQTPPAALQQDVAAMESPENIIRQAEAMGMITPDHVNFLLPPAEATPTTP